MKLYDEDIINTIRQSGLSLSVSVKGVIYSPTPFSEVIHSSEHKAIGLFRPEEIPTLRMPEGYKHSIQTWVNFLNRPEM